MDSTVGGVLPYNWGDIREREIENLGKGDVVFRLGFGCAYKTGGPDGEIAGVFGMPCGSAWRIASVRGGRYTVVRTDGGARQSFCPPSGFRVLALVAA